MRLDLSFKDFKRIFLDVGWGLSLRDFPITLRCVERIVKRSINNFSCHPELAAPLVADEKEAYKGGCSQSISGSVRRQKCSTICTQKINVGLKAQLTFFFSTKKKVSKKESTMSCVI